jgi:two-component system response regulator PhoP
MKILVIEDEDVLRKQIVQYLQDQHCVVDDVNCAEDGIYMLKEYKYDLVILDLRLPKMQGIDLILRIRKNNNAVPILVLTAKDLWQDKVEVLNAGADDYLTKPFHMEELFARIQAVIRRNSKVLGKNVIVVDDIKFDIDGFILYVKNKEVHLTSFEYKVLRYLMLHAGKVVQRHALLDYIYPSGEAKESNVLDVCVSRLRNKLDPTGKKNHIETIRGVGYKFVK